MQTFRRSRVRHASAWPDSSSLSISSKRRAAGTLLIRLGQFRDRRARGRLDLEAEFRGETHHAQHAHRIFAIPRGRVADHAQQARADVGHAVVVIQHGLRGRIVIHGIDR